MRGYVKADCEIGTMYRWIHIAQGRMTVDGVLYSGLSGEALNGECEGP